MKPSSWCFLQISPMQGAFEYARMIRSRGSPSWFKLFLKSVVNDFISSFDGLLEWYGRWRNIGLLFLLLLFDC